MLFFSSDHHFWHQNIIAYCNRPFSSVEEMNEALIDRWNSVVSPEDTVYCIGDFSLAIRPVETIPSMLNGTKILIPGNHDWCHSYHKKSRRDGVAHWTQRYTDNGWIVLPEQTQINAPNVVQICHFPYASAENDNYVDKYAKYRPEDNGDVLLCGHVHGAWDTKRSHKNSLMINVGVDVRGFAPISLNEIVDIIDKNK